MNELTQRERLWANLNQVDVTNTFPWILCGYFYNVLSSEDRMGSPMSPSEFEGFQASEKVDIIQRHIQDDLMNQMLFDQAKMLLLEIEKWIMVEEQVQRQKPRATWVECGDANSKYFYAQWKHRCNHNVISSIYIESNIKLTNPREIEAEFIGVFT
ncbi:hypothetical protein RDI58_010653 [Solanum bulbocastanum]|uniref:RNA-directed DNA polymerase (Reverse transcriptase) n=1 Tax=Solanum bulbocastanum TaxID=147425 RepID=A0AAN8TUU1_SOLBU